MPVAEVVASAFAGGEHVGGELAGQFVTQRGQPLDAFPVECLWLCHGVSSLGASGRWSAADGQVVGEEVMNEFEGSAAGSGAEGTVAREGACSEIGRAHV